MILSNKPLLAHEQRPSFWLFTGRNSEFKPGFKGELEIQTKKFKILFEFPKFLFGVPGFLFGFLYSLFRFSGLLCLNFRNLEYFGSKILQKRFLQKRYVTRFKSSVKLKKKHTHFSI
jgi:hypothetical protein